MHEFELFSVELSSSLLPGKRTAALRCGFSNVYPEAGLVDSVGFIPW